MDFGYFTLSDNYYPHNPRTASDFVLEIRDQAAIPGQHVSALISTGYIFGFRKDNAIFFSSLGQNCPDCVSLKKTISLILLDLCLRKRKK